MDPSRLSKSTKAKSQIPVIRLSRASVSKQNSTTKKQSRSSSVNRVFTLDPIRLFANSGRSQSCANLRDVGTTSVQRPGTSLATPSSCMKGTGSNKECMNAQLARIKRFMLELDPNMPPLKPLDVKVYIRCMNLLWRELDNRIIITEKNKGAIAEYMKIFKFPGLIKLSALKSPSVPHNFSYILTIWVWLLDIIEIIRNPSKILEPPTANPRALKLFKLSVTYFTSRYNLYNSSDEKAKKSYQADKNDRLFEKNYNDLLSEGNAFDLPETLKREEDLAEEISSLKQNLISTQRNRDVLLECVEEEEEKHNENCCNFEARKVASFKNKHDVLEKVDALQKVLKEKRELEAKLKDAAKNQPCSQKKWAFMKDEKEILMYSINLKKTRKDEKKELLSKLDMELLDERHKLQNIIDTINARITSEFQHRPELKELKIRETGFFQEDMIEIVNQFIRNKKELDEKLSKEQQIIKATLQDITIQNEEYATKNIQLLKKKEELEKQQQEATETLEQFRKSNQEELDQRELKLNELKDMLESMKTERPSLQGLEEKHKLYSEKYTTLVEERDKLMREGREFFRNIFNITSRRIDAQVQLENKITKALDDKYDEMYNGVLNMSKKLKEH